MAIAIIGFGEAGSTFAAGWGERRPVGSVSAYDIKTDSPATRDAMLGAIAAHGVSAAATPGEAVAGADLVLSLVPADQSLAAAASVAAHLDRGALFCDMNSVSPQTKRAAASVIAAAGRGDYVDVAVMAPVSPRLGSVPLLLAGERAHDAAARLVALGHGARVVAGPAGAATAIKMARSIMIKGLEALTAECLLSARRAGVEDEVLASLDASFPGWDWRRRADYNLDRMLVHGRRRAAEMDEAAATAAGLGQAGVMAAATAQWQERLGALALVPPPQGYAAKADAILSLAPLSS